MIYQRGSADRHSKKHGLTSSSDFLRPPNRPQYHNELTLPLLLEKSSSQRELTRRISASPSPAPLPHTLSRPTGNTYASFPNLYYLPSTNKSPRVQVGSHQLKRRPFQHILSRNGPKPKTWGMGHAGLTSRMTKSPNLSLSSSIILTTLALAIAAAGFLIPAKGGNPRMNFAVTRLGGKWGK